MGASNSKANDLKPHQIPPFQQAWLPFTRTDLPCSMYERCKIVLLGCTFAPLRFILAMTPPVGLYILARFFWLLMLVTNNNDTVRKWRFWTLRRYSTFGSYVVCWLLGIHLRVIGTRAPATTQPDGKRAEVKGCWHPERCSCNTKQQQQQQPCPCAKECIACQLPPVIVSNHLSWLDPVVIAAGCSFPAVTPKAPLQKLPLAGLVGSQCDCVWIPRTELLKSSPSATPTPSRSSTAASSPSATKVTPSTTTKVIGHHVNKYVEEIHQVWHQKYSSSSTTSTREEQTNWTDNHKSVAPIIFFPEGTTENGTELCAFRRGAFVPATPIQPVLMRYGKCRTDCINWSYETYPGLLHLIHCLVQPGITVVEVEYLPIYIPSQRECDNPALYAANVRRYMARALGVPVKRGDPTADTAGGDAEIGVGSTFADKANFHEWMMEYHISPTPRLDEDDSNEEEVRKMQAIGTKYGLWHTMKLYWFSDETTSFIQALAPLNAKVAQEIAKHK